MKNSNASQTNKQFVAAVMAQGRVPNLIGDMGPIPGMEGPFQFKSGWVGYWDNRAGKYYDHGQDIHLTDDQAWKLTL